MITIREKDVQAAVKISKLMIQEDTEYIKKILKEQLRDLYAEWNRQEAIRNNVTNEIELEAIIHEMYATDKKIKRTREKLKELDPKEFE